MDTGFLDMTENDLLRDEFRTIKAMHTESISKISDLCGEVRELVIELRHTQKDHDELQSQVKEIKLEVTDLFETHHRSKRKKKYRKKSEDNRRDDIALLGELISTSEV